MTDSNNDKQGSKDEDKAPSLWDVTKSVFSAYLGVQSSKNHKKDFTYGKPSQYIVIGIAFVVILIVSIINIVSLVLP